MRYLLIVCVVALAGCVSSEPANVSPPEVTATSSIEELCSQLKQQQGGTMGYPFWDNTILRYEPAASIIQASQHGRNRKVIDCLKAKLSDYTPCTACGHSGRGGMGSRYTVSDVACYILVEMHTAETIELVIDELRRRKAAGRNPVPVIWAIDSHHTGYSYQQRMREKLIPAEQLSK